MNILSREAPVTISPLVYDTHHPACLLQVDDQKIAVLRAEIKEILKKGEAAALLLKEAPAASSSGRDESAKVDAGDLERAAFALDQAIASDKARDHHDATACDMIEQGTPFNPNANPTRA